MKYSLQTRLWLAFAILALLVLVGAATSLQSVRAQQAMLAAGIHPSLKVLNLTEQLRETVSDTLRVSFQAGIERSDDLLYLAGTSASNFFALHEQLGTQLDQLPEESRGLAAMRSHHESIAANFRRIMASSLSLLAEQIEQGELQEAWLVQIRLASNTLAEELDTFVTLAKSDLDTQLELGRKRLDRMALLLQVSIVIALLGLVAFLLFLYRTINQPMGALTAFVDRACADPLGTEERHTAANNDEIGLLGGGINHLLDRLQQIAVSRDFFDRVFESAHVALLVVDGSDIVRRENSAARTLAGCSMNGRRVSDLLALDSCPTGCPDTCENSVLRADGTPIAVLASVAAIDDPHLGAGARVLALTDISERKAAEEGVLQRSRLLRAIAEASRHLLSGDEEGAGIRDALGIAARAVDGDRAYVFEAHRIPEGAETVISQRFEWCAPGVGPQIDMAELQAFPWHERMPRWFATMNRGEAIGGPIVDYPDDERIFFAAQDIVSLLCVPIFLDGALWGFVGVDDCRRPRRWNDFEQEALQSIGADIAQSEMRRRNEENLRLSAKVFENSGEAITVTDANARIVSVNRAFSAVTGYTPAEALGQKPSLLKSGRHDAGFYQRMWATIQADGFWEGEIWNRRKDGTIYPEWLNISTVRDREGRTTHYIGTFSDLTERKSAQARIEFLAHHDALTGLPNRVLLGERIERAILHARRDDSLVAVLFLDLDHFKRVNDSLGHAVGDRLLRMVAERLKACVRETDTVCRQGGDEFIIVLGDLHDVEAVAQIAVKILTALEEPFDVGGQQILATTSIGISVFPGDGQSPNALLKNADTAMYYAKEAGRNTSRFFENEMNVRAQERLELEARLREALALEQLRVHYQPLIRIADQAVVGAEALLRWQTPDRGMVSPAQFIPLAEETGLIIPIGEWVLNEACRQAADWARQGHPMKIAVNVSAVQVKRTDLVSTVSQALAASGLAPRYLELEITESLLMGNDDATRIVLENLVALGVGISIDDFGTGYSNLAYLQRFSIDKLKIDQTFVRHAAKGSEAVAIINAVVNMAHSLGMTVLAEGVETQEQFEMLTVLRCDEVQGYLLGRPADAETLTARLSGGKESA